MTKEKDFIIPKPLPPEGFVRLPQVTYVLGISRSTLWDGIREGKFPKPIKLGSRTTVWNVEDIRAFIKEKSSQAGNEV